MGPPGWHSGEGHATYDAPSAAAHRGDPLSTGPDGQERSASRDGETGPDGRRDPGPADGAGSVPEPPERPGYSLVRAGPSSERPVPPGPGAARPVIAVDAMGGDHAPGEIVAGALEAQREHGIRVLLTGPAARLRQVLGGMGAIDEIQIVPAEDNLAMDEGALASLRRPRSSVAVACQLVRRGEAAAVVSAGSTGGIVAIARLRLRSQPGVLRPGLAVVLPTRPGRTVLIDAGATADPKPEMLVQFGQLGVAYAQTALGVAAPRVGLLTIGTEPGKGNKFTRRAHELLASDPPNGALPLSFAGNVEGGDLLAGQLDVIVTDGFTGNVALKTLEGSIRFAAAELRAAVTGTRTARVGAFLQRRGLRELSARLDAESYGGAVLLGLGGTVVIAHGASTARAVTSACLLAADLARGQITEKITQRLGPGRSAARGGHFLRRPLPDRLVIRYRTTRSVCPVIAPGRARGADKLGSWPIHSRFSATGCTTPSSRRSARTTATPTR
jgi:phosphate acyltransferase